ncbi:hypothetical protein MAR_011731 [Mya arenaria]|uniref:B box-type domain-containing protein n=1 Tax=Mya arenaria TaxID=6604 RepID=A0ABY7FWL6_MYAAR|nr:hypothetical protein MAR_011731 [Mya arenaria]
MVTTVRHPENEVTIREKEPCVCPTKQAGCSTFAAQNSLRPNPVTPSTNKSISSTDGVGKDSIQRLFNDIANAMRKSQRNIRYEVHKDVNALYGSISNQLLKNRGEYENESEGYAEGSNFGSSDDENINRKLWHIWIKNYASILQHLDRNVRDMRYKFSIQTHLRCSRSSFRSAALLWNTGLRVEMVRLQADSSINHEQTMASNFESIQMGCDFIHDFACSACEEDGLNTEAQHFCNQCTKYYCDNCVPVHNKLYKRHAVLDRKNVKKWAAAPGTVDVLERCERHPGEALKLVCGDHDQLCCHMCVAVDHRLILPHTVVAGPLFQPV